MNKFGLFGGGFQHAYSSTLWKKPSFFEWAKNTVCDYNCFVEETIVPNIHNPTKKFAWVVENSNVLEMSNVITDIIRHAKEISESYDFLISHDKRIYSLAPNFHYLPPHGPFVQTPGIYDKTKLCSMTCSSKRIIPGHEFRLKWAKQLMGKVDIYGSGINPFKIKDDALKDYMFSVTIESAQYETYWTEKILDCFAMGTIPVYHGAPDIFNHFNMDGVILLTDDFNPDQLSPELYLSKKDAIFDNYARATKHMVIEDILWEKFLKKI